MMDTSELLRKVRKLEIKTKGLTKHIFSGEYHSAFKGRGMSFSEVRDYQYGDDVRNIDWNVTARTGGPHVKIFEEERELTVMLMIDVSASSFFGTVSRFKNDIATEMAAVLAFSAITNNDKVGAILFSDRIEKYLPPKKGKQNILRIIRELINLTPGQRNTNLSEKHDIIGVHIHDERETALPDVGLIKVIDAEKGNQRIIDTSDANIRQKYAKHYQDSLEQFKNTFAFAKSDSICISTEDDYIKALQVFFKKRSKR